MISSLNKALDPKRELELKIERKTADLGAKKKKT